MILFWVAIRWSINEIKRINFFCHCSRLPHPLSTPIPLAADYRGKQPQDARKLRHGQDEVREGYLFSLSSNVRG